MNELLKHIVMFVAVYLVLTLLFPTLMFAITVGVGTGIIIVTMVLSLVFIFMEALSMGDGW